MIKKAVKARKASDKGRHKRPPTITINNVMPICSSPPTNPRVGRGTENGEGFASAEVRRRARNQRKHSAVGAKDQAEEAAPPKQGEAAVREVKAAAEAENTAATQNKGRRDQNGKEDRRSGGSGSPPQKETVRLKVKYQQEVARPHEGLQL